MSSPVKSILIISLTNIGDIILTFPVLDIIRRDFPEAGIDVICGPKGRDLLETHPGIRQFFIFDKKQSGIQSLRWIGQLRRQFYDLVVDLRNSAIPFFIRVRRRTPPWMKRVSGEHMGRQHLNRLASVYTFKSEHAPRWALMISDTERQSVNRCIGRSNRPLVVICPGAADHKKRWTVEGFARLADTLAERWGVDICFAGDHGADREWIAEIRSQTQRVSYDVSGQLNLRELAALFERAALVISNDSGPMHMASYQNVPVLALFGPTDPVRYGPWSSQSCLIRRADQCPACRHSRSKIPHTCMIDIRFEDVIDKIRFSKNKFSFS